MKTKRLDTRITEKQKNHYEQAALLGNFSSLTKFLTTAADKEAEKIIKNHETLNLTKQDRKLFIETLLNPPEPNEALRKATYNYKKIIS